MHGDEYGKVIDSLFKSYQVMSTGAVCLIQFCDYKKGAVKLPAGC